MTRSVLIIEDDPDIASLIAMHLGDAGFETEVANAGDAGLARFRDGGFDLVVLDLMLPGLDGLSVCREIRGGDRYTPILMLTAKATELDRVLGLELGADDYLTKPFSIPELIARVKALFRRIEAMSAAGSAPPAEEVVEAGGLRIDIAKRRVEVDGEVVDLTAREFDLLLHFARHPGMVFSRVQLLDQVWGYSYEGYEHTVNTHINRLRAKIENDPGNPRFVKTVRGVGYRFGD